VNEEKHIARADSCPKCKSKLLARAGIFIFCTEHSCDWAVQSKRKEDIRVPLFSELKKEFNDEADITLKFTPGAYRCMRETFRKHKDLIHKLNPLIKNELLEDLQTISSIINSAEKAGKREG